MSHPVVPTAPDAALGRAAAEVVLPSFAGLRPPSWVLDGLVDGLAGAVLFTSNIADADQVAALTARLREAAGRPVVAIDEEGGDVTRLAHATGSPYPGNAALGVSDDTAVTWRVHRALGAELADLGVTLDLAPSIDVNAVADNPIIGTRAFGADPALVARHGVAAVGGLHAAGVTACVKHFPGHGATRTDSHHELPTVDVGPEVLWDRELVPFRAAVAAGVRCVMTAHVRVPAVTGELPATLSPAAVGGLLRGRLGFDGVVVTDALEMRGARRHGGVPATAVEALAAGADLLCLGPGQGPQVVAATVRAIADAVRRGRVPSSRLDQARARIAALGVTAATPVPVDGAAGLQAARAALRVRGTVPVLDRPLVVQLQSPPTVAAGAVPWGLAPVLPAGAGEVIVVDEHSAAPRDVLARAAGRSLVVVVRDAHRHPWMTTVTLALLAARPDVVVVEMGLPIWRPRHSGATIATYGAARVNASAALEVLGLRSDPPEVGVAAQQAP